MTNLQVVKAWNSGEPASSSNLHTDGRNLYSYQLLIGRTINRVKMVIHFHQWVTHTTRSHITLAMNYSSAAIMAPTKGDWGRLAKCLPR